MVLDMVLVKNKTPQVFHQPPLSTQDALSAGFWTPAIHTLELPKYNTAYSDWTTDDLMLGRWHWLTAHAKDYEPEEKLKAAFCGCPYPLGAPER